MSDVETKLTQELPESVLATLAEIAQEINASLNLDEVLARAAALIKRLVDYEIFAVLDGARFVRAHLRGAKLKGASARRADFYGADLSGSDMTDGDFRGSRLLQADLDDAVTEGIKTQGAVLVDGTIGQ